MGNKYHISEKGTVVICRAKVRPCPLGGGHFDTKEYQAFLLDCIYMP